MRLMLLGGPGAGKGTQAVTLTHHFNIPQISTGNMLRAAITAGSALGKRVKAVMESGQLVSDEIIIQLVKERLNEPDCQKGYLLDGFPRTLAQAQAMRDAHIHLDHIIELVVSDEEIILRLGGRRIHEASGRVYHVAFHPPKFPNQDDETGEPLIQREDDQEATIKKRLDVYHAQTKPLVDYYLQWAQTRDQNAPKVHRIEGIGDAKQISQHIIQAISAQE